MQVAPVYSDAMTTIHYMHDKYYYEAAELALEDTDVQRTFATGIAGFSHVVDSLSAMKYAKVKVIREEDGIAVDYVVEGDYPKYGNDDDRVDNLAKEVTEYFFNELIGRISFEVLFIRSTCSLQSKDAVI